MISDRLTRALARMVLASYITHLVAPVVHACEVLTLPPVDTLAKQKLVGRHFQPLKEARQPTAHVPAFVASPIDEERARLQAETYQYRLRVKTLNERDEQFQLKLSRKEKGSTGSFERLHTASINKGELTSTSSTVKDVEDDTLLNLFKSASFHKFIEGGSAVSFAWSISDLGILKLARDGTVFFDQASTSLLSAYDLVLKTSGELLLQTLGVAELTLQSPKTQILVAVATNHLHMDYDVINEGGLQVKQVTGQGTLTNHATLKLEGTQEKPAILGVSQVINRQVKGAYNEAKIEGSHLHITPENLTFYNGKDSTFTVGGKLTVEASPLESASFINNGSVYLHDATFNRDASNNGFWQAHDMTVSKNSFINNSFGTLKILNTLTAFSLFNQGDITAKNGIHLTRGHNTGTIKGDELKLEVGEKMTNVGNVSLHHLSGQGVFKNHMHLNFLGTSAELDIRQLINQTISKGRTALIKGKYLWFQKNNESFVNEVDSLVDAGLISFFGEEPKAASNPSVQNIGTISGGSLFTGPRSAENKGTLNLFHLKSEGVFENDGTLETTFLGMLKGKFHNKQRGDLKVERNFNIEEGILQNDGKMLSGTAKHLTNQFIQKSGELVNTGTWDHTGDIELGSTKVSNSGSLVWQNGTWTFAPQVFYNRGNWQLNQMECPQHLNIQNYGPLHLKDGSLDFGDLINHKDLEVSRGQYRFFGSFINHHVMRLLNHKWTFTEGTNNKAKLQLGEIECQKSYTHDVEAMPKAIRAEGDVTFTKRYQSNRTLNDLSNVIANGKVTFYCPGITTMQNYEFGNIGHLDLYVEGIFKVIHEFKVLALKLTVNGPLICGTNNTTLGTIAATEGALDITAHNIDARFGKIYGRGLTTLKSIKGNVQVGAPKQGYDQDLFDNVLAQYPTAAWL